MSSSRSSSRRQARHYVLQSLFAADLAAGVPETTQEDLWSTLIDGEGVDGVPEPASTEVEFAQRLLTGVASHREAIDALIESCSTNWRIKRMSIVDRNILRLAGFELMHCADIPASVSINEAVELAKAFGTAESRAFINGIVDRMGRQLERLPASKKEGPITG
ncbi:MAG: transcription antitermination factor NusB [Myxococcota bacterium]